MSDEDKGTSETEETPLADDELDEVSGGKILNRGGSSSQDDEDGSQLGQGDEGMGEVN